MIFGWERSSKAWDWGRDSFKAVPRTPLVLQLSSHAGCIARSSLLFCPTYTPAAFKLTHVLGLLGRHEPSAPSPAPSPALFSDFLAALCMPDAVRLTPAFPSGPLLLQHSQTPSVTLPASSFCLAPEIYCTAAGEPFKQEDCAPKIVLPATAREPPLGSKETEVLAWCWAPAPSLPVCSQHPLPCMQALAVLSLYWSGLFLRVCYLSYSPFNYSALLPA